MVEIEVQYIDSEPASVDESFVMRMFEDAPDVEVRFSGKIPFNDRKVFHKHYKRVSSGIRYITYKIDEDPSQALLHALQGLRSTLRKQYLFLICKKPLPFGVHIISDEGTVKLLTTYGWRNHCSSPSFELLIVKELIATALALITGSKMSIHENGKGCVFDAPVDINSLSAGMWGKICGNCRTQLKSKKLSDITIERLLYIQKRALSYHVEEAKVALSMPNVFVSYAKEDASQAVQIRDYLISCGFKVWMDKFNLRIGDNWEQKIRTELANSDFIVLCLSKASTAKRGFVQVETREAIRLSQYMPSQMPFILPVKIDNCSVPDELSGIHYLDLVQQGEDGLSVLSESIKHHVRDRGKSAK